MSIEKIENRGLVNGCARVRVCGDVLTRTKMEMFDSEVSQPDRVK